MGDYTFEMDYWGNCCNTFDESQKHYVYARYMGLDRTHYSFDVHGKSILDIGGGPDSMLLKTINLNFGLVVDPIEYPSWTIMRYRAHNIGVSVIRGEDLVCDGWDEVWIYNCLQHCDDAERVIHNALMAGNKLRIFEWINVPPHDGHPIMLTKELLDKWIGLPGGQVVHLAEQGCYGTAFYGVYGG